MYRNNVNLVPVKQQESNILIIEVSSVEFKSGYRSGCSHQHRSSLNEFFVFKQKMFCYL